MMAGKHAGLALAVASLLLTVPSWGTELNPAHGFHGDTRYDVLSNPQRVESYRLSDDPDATDRFGGAALVEKGPDLTRDQKKTLRDIIRTPGTYQFGRSKRCKFHPDLGLRFVKDEHTVDVVFCFSCDEWRFHDTEHPNGVTEDFDTARPKLLRMARALFPKHRAFKKYPLRKGH